MREIEFRGQRIDNGEWVCGDVEFHLVDGDLTKTEKEAFIKFQTMDSIGKVYGYTFEAIPKTIGQYTGLKDKNGVKIFEGDVIVLSNDDVKGEIIFNEKISAFQLRYLGELGELFEPKFLGEWITCYSIIGNIHDNSELLGGE